MFLENIVNPITIKFKFNSRGSYPFRPPEVLIGKSNYSYKCLLPAQWSFAQKIYGMNALVALLCTFVKIGVLPINY